MLKKRVLCAQSQRHSKHLPSNTVVYAHNNVFFSYLAEPVGGVFVHVLVELDGSVGDHVLHDAGQLGHHLLQLSGLEIVIIILAIILARCD